MPHVEMVESSSHVLTYPVLTYYKDKLEALTSMGIHPYEVRVHSDRFGVNDVFKFKSEEDAYEFARALVEAARVTHGEEFIPTRWASDRQMLSRTYSYEEVFQDYESPVFRKGWTVILYCLFPRVRNTEDIQSGPATFVAGWRYGAMCLSNPSSKVFVRYAGRDCDGYSWESVYEYPSLREAADGFEGHADSADGPMGYNVISRDEFETY